MDRAFEFIKPPCRKSALEKYGVPFPGESKKLRIEADTVLLGSCKLWYPRSRLVKVGNGQFIYIGKEPHRIVDAISDARLISRVI